MCGLMARNVRPTAPRRVCKHASGVAEGPPRSTLDVRTPWESLVAVDKRGRVSRDDGWYRFPCYVADGSTTCGANVVR
jgi:hypothetical protein